VDLTGLELAVLDEDMPIDVAIASPEPAEGKVELTFPDTTPLRLNKAYQMRVRVGAAGSPGAFTTPLIEVVAS
jgi:hypothetical protein